MDTNKEMLKEEQALIQKAQAGDSESIEEIIINYKALVRSIARSKFFLVWGGESDDLVQEGTIGLLKAIREYRAEKNKSGFAAFAAVCIRSKITDAMRAYSREKHKALNTATNLLAGENEEEYLADCDVQATDPLTNYIDEEETEIFYKKIESVLNARQAQALKLYLDGYSYKEIAERLNVSSKTVDNMLTTAKDRIKKAKEVFNDNKR